MAMSVAYETNLFMIASNINNQNAKNTLLNKNLNINYLLVLFTEG